MGLEPGGVCTVDEETEKRGEEDRAFNVSIKSGSGRMKIFRIAFPMAVRGGCNQPYLTE